MAKEVYFIDNKYLVQKRLQRIPLPSIGERLKNNLWSNFTTYFLLSLIFLFFVFILLVILTSKYELDGTSKINKTFLKDSHILGTDPLGRDNFMLFSVSWINVFIYLLLTLLNSLIISFIFIFFLIKWKGLMKFFKVLKKYEGMLVLPILLIICALFLNYSFLFFILMSSIPIAISLSHEISINWKYQKFANYHKATYNSIYGWKNVTIVRWVFIVIKSFLNITIRSVIYLLFWEFQFSYLELITTYNSFLIGNTNTLGAYVWNNLDLLLSNPQVLIIAVVSFILLLSCLSIIYLNKEQKNFSFLGNKYDIY